MPTTQKTKMKENRELYAHPVRPVAKKQPLRKKI